jgi:uncharacterized protein YbaP (TraB family)
MMRRKGINSFYLLVVFNLVFSWGSLGDQEKSFLWKVDGDSNSCYLLGSIHALKKDVYPLKNVIEKAFAESELLAVEADLSSPKLGEALRLTMEKGQYTGEDTLEKNLTSETFELAKNKMQEMGMDIKGFNRFKPWFLAMTISSMELFKLGFNPNYGIDKYFMDKATGTKEIVELEGVEFQLDIFDSLSNDENDKFLQYTILEANQLKQEVENIINAWSTGDVKKLEMVFKENIKRYPEFKDFFKKINEDRNVKMVDKILSYLKSGKRYFVVIGAAHMVGNRGIVQLLREKGIKVTQQ